MLLGLQFVMSRPGPAGKQIDGTHLVDANPIVVVPLIGLLASLIVYRVGCVFAYQCEPFRLAPFSIPQDMFFAIGCAAALIAMRRLTVRYDDRHITIGRVFGSPETIPWDAIQEARWVGRYGELLIIWRDGKREIHHWWRGAGQFVDALRSHGLEVPPAPRPFKK
jgi:hypothetical protein